MCKWKVRHPPAGGGANGSGLAINADGTTWWGSGTCDESCQRWISACVLARTNAYGVHVRISLRAPADAPQAIKDALAVTDLERNGADAGTDAGGDAGIEPFSLREGAYYGNIFATTPVNPAPSPTQGPDGGVVPYTGPAIGPIASTPAYYACAGPGSNIPEITKRFCSSQGDQVVIKVPGVCLGTKTELGTCRTEDTDPSSSTFGAIQDCHTKAATSPRAACADYRDPSCYSEVLTVYLEQPISVCGNGVCEDGEDLSTDPGYCPSDCHPNTWATSITEPGSVDTYVKNGLVVASTGLSQSDMFAISSKDSSIVLPAMVGGLGGASTLSKYDSDGGITWQTTLNVSNEEGRVAVAADGTIFALTNGVGDIGESIAVFDSSGMPINTFQVDPTDQISVSSMIVDHDGNLIVTGDDLSIAVLTTGIQSMIKFNPKGGMIWSILQPGPYGATSLAVDSNNNVIEAYNDVNGAAYVQKFCADGSGGGFDGTYWAPTCSSSWTKKMGDMTGYPVAAVDRYDDVYVTGLAHFPGDEQDVPHVFLTKLNGTDGTYQWPKPIAPAFICSPIGLGPACVYGNLYGALLAFDSNDNVLMASYGNPSLGGGVDFGAGTFPTYSANNIFISAYSFGGEFRWAKQIPIILNSALAGLGVNADKRVVVGGFYAGSMQADDLLLVTSVPEDPSTVQAFFASFQERSPDDTTAPGNGVAKDLTGATFSTVPNNIVVQATSSAGAAVFFMPPTAIDTGNAGVSVICSPRPNSVFPLGPPTSPLGQTTTVTCTATDPLGNTCTLSQPGCTAQVSFTVTVVDTVGPVFSPVPDLQVRATSGNGANSVYTTPSAIDQVDGPVAVSCLPSSTSTFAVGATTVTCTASDARNNQSAVSFTVTVNPPYGEACAKQADCGGSACIDGVCCNSTASSCGQCQACNVPGSVGTCAPTTGGSCDDGNACTLVDACQNGTCVGGASVTCSPSDQCHVAGICDSNTGICSNPVALDGSTCDDGNACTQTDSCQAGVCIGTNLIRSFAASKMPAISRGAAIPRWASARTPSRRRR
jgi:hypothetical protein